MKPVRKWIDFSKRYKLLNWIQEETEGQQTIKIKDIELAIKCFLQQKPQEKDGEPKAGINWQWIGKDNSQEEI